MSLVTEIETIVKNISPDATFLLSSIFKANVKSFSINKKNLPLVIFENEIPKDVEVMKNANLQASTRIRLRFLTLDNPHKTDLEREEIRQAMEDIANRVMVRIFQLEEIRMIPATTNFKYRLTPLFNQFAKDLTGVMVEVTANENLIINWC